MKYNDKILNLAEYTCIASSVIGTVAAIATQQAAYAAIPLTVALSLNVFNRNRFQQQIIRQEQNNRQFLQSALVEVRQSISEGQNNAVTYITQIRQQLLDRIQSLQAQIETLPPQQSIDLTEVQTQINHINQQLQQFSQLENRNHSFFNDYTQHMVPKVCQLVSEKTSIQEAVVQLTAQLNTLEVTFNNIPPKETVDLSEIEEAIANLRIQLRDLNQQFSSRLEPLEIERLSEAVNIANQRINNLQNVEEAISILEAQLKNHTRNLDEMQQKLIYLQQLLTGYTKTEDLESILSKLRKELLGQVETSIENIEDMSTILGTFFKYSK
ncbi:MAG: hypothetical protein SAL70_02510 [Scytonema sp. PMC 1070.18]|nr:hypothetical protein [Scytonema sp. PMC 1070.18]